MPDLLAHLFVKFSSYMARPVDTSERCSSISSSHLRDMSNFRTHGSHLGIAVFWPGTFSHIVFPSFTRLSILISNALHLVHLDEIPTAWEFFVVSLVIFNQIFLLDPGICWQTQFTLDGNFASYFSC